MAESRSLVARLLNTPDLARIVPQLQPEILHRVIQVCGLEDAAEFVALATPQQLGRILDVDLWRAGRSGGDDAFDADRFGLWVEVLMQAGLDVAAEKLTGLDIELVIAGCARHLAVFDYAAVSPYTTLDGQEIAGRTTSGRPAAEIGGYLVEARRTAAFEVLVDVLAFLGAEHPAFFHRVMRGCVRLSNGAREHDGLHDLLDDAEQDLFDLSSDREARREAQGYVSAAQAHAFLRGARDVDLCGARPSSDVIAAASFRAVASALAAGGDQPDATAQLSPESTVSPESNGASTGVEAVIEILRDAGVLDQAPRALLGPGEATDPPLAQLRTHLSTHATGSDELAFVANALAAGCTIQGRAFTPREASDGAAATCNLGLENWPPHWPDPDVITAFQVGWTVLHRDVGISSARRVIAALADIRCADRDIQMRLDALRRDLTTAVRDGVPWRARPGVDALLMLDASVWAAVLALVDECPAVHAVVTAPRACRTINPSDFSFVTQNRDIAAVHAFLQSLPERLTA